MAEGGSREGGSREGGNIFFWLLISEVMPSSALFCSLLTTVTSDPQQPSDSYAQCLGQAYQLYALSLQQLHLTPISFNIVRLRLVRLGRPTSCPEEECGP